MGSLHLDADDEPRRGASRANSVRFDESALQGPFGHGSRASTDLIPSRTGSAFGSHPMTERSLSHKSDGRQSSAGQSTHSNRASSFGFDVSRPLSATVPPFVPGAGLGPPPGLFILGPVPAIIRCWLTNNFKRDTMLYAAVCTGSYRSIVDLGLLCQLGYEKNVTFDHEGQRTIKLPVYLPEARIQQSSSRSNSPANQLPTLSIDFVVRDAQDESKALRIFLGCDVLRARNADIQFSLDRMTLFDDERNKVTLPLSRPEDASLYQYLQTSASVDPSGYNPVDNHAQPLANASARNEELSESTEDKGARSKPDTSERLATQSSDDAIDTWDAVAAAPSVIGEGRKASITRINEEPPTAKLKTETKDLGHFNSGTTPDTPTKPDTGNIWGSWRRDKGQSGNPEGILGASTSSNYQRAGRGRGMKVLKPARLSTSRSVSSPQTVGFEAGDPRTPDTAKLSSPAEKSENINPALRNISSGDVKQTSSASIKPRPSNPVGGASAFGWLNPGQSRQATGNGD